MSDVVELTPSEQFLEDLKGIKSFDELMSIDVPCVPPDQILNCANPLINSLANNIDMLQSYNDFARQLISNPFSLDTFNQWMNL
jgi:hypothetical protein